MDSRPKLIRWLNRLSVPLELCGIASGLLFFWYITDIPLSALIGTGIAFVSVDLWQFVKRRYGLNRGWGKLPLGFGLLAFGIYVLTFSAGTGSPTAGFILAGFVTVGVWLTLDACYDLRTGAGATTAGTPNRMGQFGDAAIVGRALEDEPHSIGELDNRLELSGRRIESALSMLTDVGAVDKRGGYYYATLEDRNLSDTLRDTPSQLTSRVRSVPERLIRPFRLFDS